MKYLFTATYKDGSTYTQNVEDVSVLDERRSCFSDVDKDNLKTFQLDGEHIYLVDLEDGHFEVDGVPFLLHEEMLKDFKIIFFRRHTHDFNVAHEEIGHRMVYRLGWQSGSEQRVMQIE